MNNVERVLAESCPSCQGVPEEGRLATRKAPYHYRLSGLSEVYLCRIMLLTCHSCDVHCPVVPCIGRLHEAIAKAILWKPERLLGEEIKFVRKQMGMLAKNFCGMVGITAEHLSRVEHGKDIPGLQLDLLTRAVCGAGLLPLDEMRGLILSNHDYLPAKRLPMVFEFTLKGEWEQVK